MIDIIAAVRAYVEPISPSPREDRHIPLKGWRSSRYGARVLTFDTETTTDFSQRLLVGGYRIDEWDSAAYRCVERGVVLGDRVLSPRARRLVRRYAKQHGFRALSRQDFAYLLIWEGYRLGTLVVDFNLPFDLGGLAIGWGRGRKRWRRGFRLRLVKGCAHPPIRVRGGARNIAHFIEWGSYHREAMGRVERGRRPFVGRFLDLRTWMYGLFGKKHGLESACAFLGLPYRKRRVAYGRVDRELLDYLIDDIDATWALFLRLRDQWNRLPFVTPVPSPVLPRGARPEDTPDLADDATLPSRMYSPASVAKRLYHPMGLRPLAEIQPDFSRDAAGFFMSTYYGGWNEPHILRVPLPVRYLDISATYLRMAVLLDLWELVAAERIEVVEGDPESVRAELEQLTLEDLFRPETWRGRFTICLIEPNDDILPVKTQLESNGDYQLMLNRTSAAPGLALWWTWFDTMATKLRTGRVPRIVRVLHAVRHGRQTGLKPVALLEGVSLDPSTDPFQTLLEARRETKERLSEARAAGCTETVAALERVDQFLKALSEPIAYGVHAEVDDHDETGARQAEVWGLRQFRTDITHEEHPGRYLNSFVAPFPTAAARLAMAMMEALLRGRGGTWVTNDTDSFMPVSTPEGGLISCPGGAHTLPTSAAGIRALSYSSLEEVRALFDSLAPAGGPFWKYEDENAPDSRSRDGLLYALCTGAKRYALANVGPDGSIIIRKVSEHGLGALLNPKGRKEEPWIEEIWTAAFREFLGPGGALEDLPFGDTPAVSRFPIVRPDILRLLSNGTNGREHRRSRNQNAPRPFGSLLAVPVQDAATGGAAYFTGLCRIDGQDHTGCPTPSLACRFRARCPLAHPIRAIAPFEDNRKRWKRLRLYDLRTRRPIAPLWFRPEFPRERPVVVTLGDLIEQHVYHAERRYLGPDGQQCEAWTQGEIQRQHVRIIDVRHIGKESRQLEEVQAGLCDPGETYQIYLPPQLSVNEIRERLKPIPLRWLVRQTGRDRRTIQRVRNGQAIPRDELWLLLGNAIGTWEAKVSDTLPARTGGG